MSTFSYLTPAIVVGVDGRPSGDTALRWALATGRAMRRPVRAVTVVAPPALPAGGFDGVVLFPEPDPFDASVRLERALERAEPDPSARAAIERRVVLGGVTDRLLAESEGAAMLVVGQSSRRMLSAARQLVTRASCPVVVVPAGADALASTAAPAELELAAAAGEPRLVAAG